MALRKLFFHLVIAALLVGCSKPEKSADTGQRLVANSRLPKKLVAGMTVKTTPVKHQGTSELCWVYAMLATIESEHLMLGDSVNLSPAFIARHLLTQQAQAYYFSDGKQPIKLRGMASMLLAYLQRYGAEPYDSYEDRPDTDFPTIIRKLERLSDAARSRREPYGEYRRRVEDLLDESMGYMPSVAVHMLGAEYTPMEFARSVCLPGEYLSLTSFTHHPFNEPFVLETPDNRLQDQFLNLPLDTLMAHVKRALRAGHPVCWEGDISNPGFMEPVEGLAEAVVKAPTPISQHYRQQAFERLETTDDHAMEMVGMVRLRGKNYFICKNSWGTGFGLGGFICLSEDYVRLYTVAVFMSERAYRAK